MHRAAIAGNRLQKAVDWAVFGIGVIALSTAILGTAFSTDDDRLAEAPAAEAAELG